jgi:hypothetical protein
MVAASLVLASLGSEMGSSADHMPTEDSGIGFYPLIGSARAHPISKFSEPFEVFGSGDGPSVVASGACGTVALAATYISPTATRWEVQVFSVAPVKYADNVRVTYDVGNNKGSTYFDPRGLAWSAQSPIVEASQQYGDVSADFSGFVYSSSIGWCYFNTPELYYNLN